MRVGRSGQRAEAADYGCARAEHPELDPGSETQTQTPTQTQTLTLRQSLSNSPLAIWTPQTPQCPAQTRKAFAPVFPARVQS
eukprot:3204056-Rhodomonas_salina.1